jgi:hypothetical protein
MKSDSEKSEKEMKSKLESCHNESENSGSLQSENFSKSICHKRKYHRADKRGICIDCGKAVPVLQDKEKSVKEQVLEEMIDKVIGYVSELATKKNNPYYTNENGFVWEHCTEDIIDCLEKLKERSEVNG